MSVPDTSSLIDSAKYSAPDAILVINAVKPSCGQRHPLSYCKDIHQFLESSDLTAEAKLSIEASAARSESSGLEFRSQVNGNGVSQAVLAVALLMQKVDCVTYQWAEYYASDGKGIPITSEDYP